MPSTDAQVKDEPEFVRVTSTDELPEGTGKAFVVGERMIAVFCQHGEYFAIDDSCPHMGASLAEGPLGEDGIVTCPWHSWRYAICDGTWCNNPRSGTDSFKVRVIDSDVFVATLPTPRSDRANE